MRSTRSSLRAWWKELAAAGVCLLTFCTSGPAGALAIAFVLGIGWAMGHSHRTLPLHGKVDRMTGMVGELVDEVRTRETGPAENRGRPDLRLVRKGDTA